MVDDSLHREDGAEDVIPDLARYAEAELKVLVMMRKMVFLHLSHVFWQLRVVQSVVHTVVQHV